MGARNGCGRLALGCLFLLVALLVFAALAAALVLTGEVPLYAPRLTGFEPVPNYAFRPTTPITLTFDQPMDPASVRASFALIPAVAGTFHWNEGRTRFTFVPQAPGYEPGQKYRVRLAPGVKAGTLPRTTAQGTEWDIVLQPLQQAQSPPEGEADLGALPRLEATFNYPLDCDLTLQTFVITPRVAGQTGCDGQTLAFHPTHPLAPGTTYTAAFAHLFLQDDPSPRPGTEWKFTTAPPLTVVDASPVEGALVEDLWTPVRITFNRPVLPNSVTGNFALTIQDGPARTGQITWHDGNTGFVFQPDQALEPATRYELVLHKKVRDELGFELANGLAYAFDTTDLLGQPSPAPGSSDVALDSPIRLPFTRPMDRDSVEAGLLVSPTLEMAAAWEQSTLILTPRRGLAGDTTYQVTLAADVRDASGAPLAADRQWTFATEPLLLDAQMPSTPVLMELQQPISLTFALPMDLASVHSALTISPDTSGELDWRDDNRSVTFRPTPGWLAGARYEISLSASARVAGGGQEIGKEHTWTFATGLAHIQFGEGPNVQVMDAGGDRAFQMLAQGADVADFSLYALTSTQFLDLYSAGAQSSTPQAPPIVDTTNLTPTVAWREALAWFGGQVYDGWHSAEAHLPADTPPGLYLLAPTSSADEPGQAGGDGQILVVLTHHRLVLKQSVAGSGDQARARVLAWDTEIGSSTPIVSATVHLYDSGGTLLAEGLTGSDGLLTLDLPGDPAPLLALSTAAVPAEVGGEESSSVTVCGLSSEWSETGWWEWWTQPPARPLYTIYTYTDRPIYRPGQTVSFKAWIRADDDVSYTLPLSLPRPAGAAAGGAITVRLRDARDNVAATRVLTLTQFGTVSGEFRLANETMLGTWNLETEVDGTLSRQSFEVEAYHKPEYEVTVQTPQKTYVAGEPISVTVDASYYFGQPVSSAEVEILAYAAYAGGLGSETLGAAGTGYGDPIWRETGSTDAGGRWTGVVPTDRVFDFHETTDRAVLALKATLTDGAGQSVSGYRTVTVQRTALGLSLFLERHSYPPGEGIPILATVRDREGQPIAGVELAAQMLGTDDREVATASATTDDLGQATLTMTLAEQGWYQVRVHDDSRPAEQALAADWLWVYDPSGQAAWYTDQGNAGQTLSIQADRAAYAPGDEAQLAIYAPASGPALLTLERGSVRDAEPIALITGTNLLTLPIDAGDAPNVHVSVSQFGPWAESDLGGWPAQTRPEAQLRTASTQLLVPMADRRLTVTITTDQQTYEPGNEATFHFKVTDRQGQPVVAEVSLAVVDEAIYALAADRSQDPFDAFYAPRPNLVRTTDSLRPTRWLYPHGGTGGGEAGGAVALRHTFLDTAYWAPEVTTGTDGEAQVTFTLPDNLTEWRALARAVTTDTLVGQGISGLIVSQDVVVRPALPRFLIQGDAITLTSVVHNFTAQPVSATVELEVEGLVPPGDPAQVVGVPAGGATTVGWPVVATAPGEAMVTLQVTAVRGARVVGRDRVQRPLAVQPLAAPEVVAFAGDLNPTQPTATITFTLPAQTAQQTGDPGRIEIDLAPSLVAGLLDGLEYLIGYPYGCVEQTMSRVLPNAMVAQMLDRLGIRSDFLEADLPSMVDLGLQTLYGFQHDDGGWGWWHDDASTPEQTAYVLFGLAMTGQAGFGVDGGVMERGAAALQSMLPGADPRTQAYATYVLATIGQPLTATLPLSDALSLDLFSQAALAIALDATGNVSGTQALMDNLRDAAIQEATAVYWPEAPDDTVYSRRAMGSTERTTAMVVDALVRLDPESPLLPGAVRWLMGHRQGQGWGDTQKSSYAVLALTDYLLATRELGQETPVQIYVNDTLWKSGRLDPGQVSPTLVLTYGTASTTEAIGVGQVGTPEVTATLGVTPTESSTLTDTAATNPMSTSVPALAGTGTTLSSTLLHAGENRIRLVLGTPGEEPPGSLYYAFTLTTRQAPDEGIFAAHLSHARSISVTREYRVQGSSRSSTSFQRGDLVQVSLTLDVPQETWHVLVEDAFPAGFEPIDGSPAASSLAAETEGEPAVGWPGAASGVGQMYDDRIAFLITRLPPGRHVYTYLMRATATGSFTAMPTQVYPMYEPEVWSRAESLRIQIEPR